MEADRMNRRTFMRGAAGAAGAAGVVYGSGQIAPRYSPIGRASAVAPVVFAAGMGGGAVAVWAGKSIYDKYFSDDEDLSGYTGSDALWTTIEDKAKTLKLNQENVLSSLENTVEFSDRVGVAEGAQAVNKAFEQEKTQSEAQANMEAAIDEGYFVPIQKDILNAYESAVLQLFNWRDQIVAHTAGDGDTAVVPADIFTVEVTDFGTPEWVAETDDVNYRHENVARAFWGDDPSQTYIDYHDPYDVTLVDGSTHSVVAVEADQSSSSYELKGSMFPDGTGAYHVVRHGVLPNELRGSDPRTSEADLIMPLEFDRFHTMWSEVEAARDRVYAEMSNYVSDLYNTYEFGEIDPSELWTPVDFFEAADEDAESSYSDAVLRATGVPKSEERMEIHLKTDDVTVEGALYTLDGALSLDVGTEYDPSTMEEAIYLTYVYEDSDGVEQDETGRLTQPFEVLSATDADGNDLNSVTFQSDRQYDPADVEALIEDLRRTQEAYNEMLAEQADETTSGGSATTSLWDRFAVDLGFGEIPGEVVAGSLGIGGTVAAAKAGLIGGGGSPPPRGPN